MLKTILLLSLLALATCGLLGGFEEVDVNDEEVQTAAGHAARALSKKFSSPYHHKLVKVLRAKRQVVAGTNFKLDVVVGLTDCKKSEVEYEQVEDCDLQDSGSTYKKCEVTVYRDLKNNHKLVWSGCLLTSKDSI